MKKILERLLVFFVGLPLIAALVLFLPWRGHLVLNGLIVVLSALGAAEFAAMLGTKRLFVQKREALALGALLPLAETLRSGFFPLFTEIPPSFAILVLALSWVLATRIFVHGKTREKLESGLEHIAGGIAVLAYPGTFLVPLVRMGGLEHSSALLLAFLISVFGNDSLAWASGMLFGKNNRGIIAASPNKSLAGFIGGLSASLATGIAAAILVPAAFTARFPQTLPAPFAGAILGLVSGIAATLGDLAESVMKRSAGIKDSGAIIPGRGGVLDSIDSIAFAAPVFFGLYRILFV